VVARALQKEAERIAGEGQEVAEERLAPGAGRPPGGVL
jgi:hypothetical protein